MPKGWNVSVPTMTPGFKSHHGQSVKEMTLIILAWGDDISMCQPSEVSKNYTRG